MSPQERLGALGRQVIFKEDMTSVKEELEQRLVQAVADGKIPHAIVYATNRDGSFTYSFATGKQNHGIDDEPIHKDAALMLASQSKLLTSIAILQLVEQGVIGLDDDVSPHIPEFGALGIIKGFDNEDQPILEKRKGPVTLRQLLTHTSGASYSMTPDVVKHNLQRGKGGTKQDLAATILERFDSALCFEPGTSWLYSSGLDWAGLVLQRLTKMTLDGFMQKNICQPLGITSITFWPKTRPDLKVPQLTVRTPDGKLVPFTDASINTNSTDDFGGHGAYAQLGDYIKVLQAILANDGKLLSPKTVDMMFTPQLDEATSQAFAGFREAFGGMLIGEITPGIPMDHGLGGALYMKDDQGRRKKGTMHWGGLVNPYWMIDREAGLALTFGTQVLPPGDPSCKEVTGWVERAVYKMAGVTV